MSRHSAYDDGHVVEPEGANHQRQNHKKTDHISQGSVGPAEGTGQCFLFCLFTSFFGNPIPEMVVPVYEFLFVGEVELLPVLEEVRESKRHSTVVHPTTTVVSLEEEIVSLVNSITGFT